MANGAGALWRLSLYYVLFELFSILRAPCSGWPANWQYEAAIKYPCPISPFLYVMLMLPILSFAMQVLGSSLSSLRVHNSS